MSLSEKRLAAFHQNAPAALARRSRSAMMQETWGGVQTIVFGALPIVGVFYWGWSAIEMFLFLLVSLWTGIFCDLTKVIWLERRAQAFADARLRDYQVWVVVDELRAEEAKRGAESQGDAAGSNDEEDAEKPDPAAGGTAEPRADTATRITRRKPDDRVWRPWQGIFIDFVMGGISTVMIVSLLMFEVGADLSAVVSRKLQLGIAALLVSCILFTAFEIVQHRQRASDPDDNPVFDRPVKALVALRGVALFLLMFLVVFLTDKTEGDADTIWTVAMTIINSLVVLFGLVNATGWLWLRHETHWLRDYLNRHGIRELAI